MPTRIRDSDEIAQVHAKLHETLLSQGRMIGNVTVANPGKTRTMDVVWIPAADVWVGTEAKKNRFMNYLGIGQPYEHRSHSPVCELNFLFGGGDSVAGVFARDNDGAIWIGHRGKLGGAQRVTNENFKDWFRLGWMTVDGNPVAKVGNLHSREVIHEIAAFVTEVKRLTEERHR